MTDAFLVSLFIRGRPTPIIGRVTVADARDEILRTDAETLKEMFRPGPPPTAEELRSRFAVRQALGVVISERIRTSPETTVILFSGPTTWSTPAPNIDLVEVTDERGLGAVPEREYRRTGSTGFRITQPSTGD
jgi:hypothetical protein